MSFRRIGLVVVFVIAATIAGREFADPAAAAPAKNPEDFINSLARSALQTLNENLPDAKREERFKTLLEANFDMARISRYVLGRYWKTASEQEKQEFQSLFEAYVVRAYSNRFSEYSGETVKVVKSRPEGQDLTMVFSEIVRPSGGPNVKVDWTVHQTGSDYRIVDVSVEGVSMALTQQQEFATVIERNGGKVADLNRAIRDKLNSTTAAAQIR